MIRLNYKVSRTTTLEPDIIIEKILQEIDQPAYTIINETTNNIEFKQRLSWGIIRNRRMEAGKVNWGRFELVSSGNETIINFYYYHSILKMVSFMCLFLIFACSGTSGWGALYFFGPIFIIVLVFTIIHYY